MLNDEDYNKMYLVAIEIIKKQNSFHQMDNKITYFWWFFISLICWIYKKIHQMPGLVNGLKQIKNHVIKFYLFTMDYYLWHFDIRPFSNRTFFISIQDAQIHPLPLNSRYIWLLWLFLRDISEQNNQIQSQRVALVTLNRLLGNWLMVAFFAYSKLAHTCSINTYFAITLRTFAA